MSIQQHELKDLLAYDPDTGIFTWKRQVASWIPVGSVAGNLCNGYIQIRIKGKLYYAHRLAVLYIQGDFPANQVDHINGNKSDNRWINLREATDLENRRNMARSSTNTSGVTGVCWDKKKQKWMVRIYIQGKAKFIGYFDDLNAAIESRKEAEVQHKYHPNHGRDPV